MIKLFFYITFNKNKNMNYSEKEKIFQKLNDDNFLSIMNMIKTTGCYVNGQIKIDNIIIQNILKLNSKNKKNVFDNYINKSTSNIFYSNIDDLSYMYENVVNYNFLYLKLYEKQFDLFLNMCISRNVDSKNYGLFIYYLICTKSKKTVDNYINKILENNLIKGKDKLYKLLTCAASFDKLIYNFNDFRIKFLKYYKDDINKFKSNQIYDILLKLKKSRTNINYKKLYESNIVNITPNIFLKFNTKFDDKILSQYINILKKTNFNTSDIINMISRIRSKNTLYIFLSELFKDYSSECEQINSLLLFIYIEKINYLTPTTYVDKILNLFIKNNLDCDKFIDAISINNNRINDSLYKHIIYVIEQIKRKNKLSKLINE